jgi:hypothetical protein
VAERLTADLVRALTNDDNAGARLAELERNGVFLVELEDRTWYLSIAVRRAAEGPHATGRPSAGRRAAPAGRRLVALRIARRAVAERIEIDERRQAVESLWGRLFETLFQQTATVAAIGLVIALGAWLAGPSRLAVGLRARVGSRGGGTSQAATEPSGLARRLGAHRSGVRLGILAIAAAVLLLLPEITALGVVVVAVLALVAIVGAEILAQPRPTPAP